MMKNTPCILYLSHGGGPLPLLGDDGHIEMVACLKDIAAGISKPSAMLVISAHWEEDTPSLTSGARPDLIYDYSGFPEESYRIIYPCQGAPELAEDIRSALENANIRVRLDENRGLDHGLFVPLKIMYPAADIPCLQLSLVRGLDPKEHIDLGRALRALNYENLLVIGSGFSFHNMRAFFTPETSDSKRKNESFDQWLIDTCSNQDIDEKERTRRLEQWMDAPFARYCHPREEHLLPLHVCYGLAGAACTEYFELKILNKQSSMYLWTPP